MSLNPVRTFFLSKIGDLNIGQRNRLADELELTERTIRNWINDNTPCPKWLLYIDWPKLLNKIK